MKHFLYLFTAALLSYACSSVRPSSKNKGFDLRYTAQDETEIKHYLLLLTAGKQQVEAYFGAKFAQPFLVTVHQDRAALDSCWQERWKMPEFHSECWMVASGESTYLDLLSPKSWAEFACEHRWEDQVASARLIAHEMTHVFHGQHNASPDFSDTDRIDWFVEGLAVCVSGQCDSVRLAGLKNWLKEHPAPSSLDQFWTGKQKYGLSGSVVLYLEQKLGRKKLFQVLVFNKKDQLLNALGITEAELLKGWKAWLLGKG